MALTLDVKNDLFYQQGEKQGEKRGAKRKASEIAAGLLKEGLSTDVISRVTELTPGEIEALRQKLQTGDRKK